MMPNVSCRVAVVGVFATAVACADGSGGWGVIVYDSAGVQIVDATELDGDAVETWHIEREAHVSIGTSEGDSTYQFHRIAGAFAHRRGYVVGDGGSGEIRHFGPSGAFLSAAGGRGDGPGEYAVLSRIGRMVGDSIWAWDLANQRIAIHGSDLSFVRVDRFVTSTLWLLSGVFGDGDLALFTFPTAGPRPASRQIVIDTITVNQVRHSDPEVLREVVRLLRRPVSVGPDGPRIPVPFSVDPLVVVGDRTVVTGDGSAGQIMKWSKQGSLLSIVRLRAGRTITSRDITAYRAVFLEGQSEQRRPEAARILDELTPPPTLPAFDRLLVDADGLLWARHYVAPEDSVKLWIVLDDGRPIRQVSSPIDLEILSIESDEVIGRWRDQFDVEHLRVHRLSR